MHASASGRIEANYQSNTYLAIMGANDTDFLSSMTVRPTKKETHKSS